MAAPIQFWLARVSRFIGRTFLRVAGQLALAVRDSPADVAAKSLAALRLRYPDAPMHWLEAVAERMQMPMDAATPPVARAVKRSLAAAPRAAGVAGADNQEARPRLTRDAMQPEVQPATVDESSRPRQPVEFLSLPQRPANLRPVFVSRPNPDKQVPLTLLASEWQAARRPKVIFDVAQGRRVPDLSSVRRAEDRMSRKSKSTLRAERDLFTAEDRPVKQAPRWISQLPPGRGAREPHHPAALSITPQLSNRDEAQTAFAAPSARSYQPAPIEWSHSSKASRSRASGSEIAQTPGPIRTLPFVVIDAGSSDRWPELPPILPSDPASRAVDLIEERARIERLKRDQTERLWNG